MSWARLLVPLYRRIALVLVLLLPCAPAFPARLNREASVVAVRSCSPDRYGGQMCTVTVTNTLDVPLVGPVRLFLQQDASPTARLRFPDGRLETGEDYLDVPLVDGLLRPKESRGLTVNFAGVHDALHDAPVGIDASPLYAQDRATVTACGDFRPFLPGVLDDPGLPATAVVRFDHVVRGRTDASGCLTVPVLKSTRSVSIEVQPTIYGEEWLPPMVTTASYRVQVPLDDGKEGSYGDPTLRFEQLDRGVLPYDADRLTFVFVEDQREWIPARLLAVTLDSSRIHADLGGAFHLESDGRIAGPVAVLDKAIGNVREPFSIAIEASDAEGRNRFAMVGFFRGDHRFEVRVDRADLPAGRALAGIQATGEVAECGLDVSARTDDEGRLSLPDLCKGTLDLHLAVPGNEAEPDFRARIAVDRNRKVVVRLPEMP